MTLPATVWNAISEGFIEDAAFRRIASIPAPTMLIWGDRDTVGTRSEQDLMTAPIPNARPVVYAESGHAVHWQQPARVAHDLTTFVAGLGG